MQSLSATTAAATAVQNPSVGDLHILKDKTQQERNSYAVARIQSICKSCYCCGAMPPHLKKDWPCQRLQNAISMLKKGHFKGSCRSKKEEKEMGRTKDVRTSAEINKSP